jgi:hypothetical protein
MFIMKQQNDFNFQEPSDQDIAVLQHDQVCYVKNWWQNEKLNWINIHKTIHIWKWCIFQWICFQWKAT